MEATTLNQTQIHLLKMFSYAKTDEALQRLKAALVAFYSQKIDEEMDALWKSGEMNDEKQESFKNGHQRMTANRL